jgi:hypothetical protein
MVIYVKAFITEDGVIQAELPPDHPVGEVTVIIESASTSDKDWENQPWTEAELKELLRPQPSTLGEMLDEGVVGLGAEDFKHISDSAAWIEETRRDEEEQNH